MALAQAGGILAQVRQTWRQQVEVHARRKRGAWGAIDWVAVPDLSAVRFRHPRPPVVGDLKGHAMIIYLDCSGTNDGNVTIMSNPKPDRVTLSLARYGTTDGYDLSVSLSLRPDVARQIAAALESAADELADAHDLPPNARVVNQDESAGFDAVAIADQTF
jgi:hypothetical protein